MAKKIKRTKAAAVALPRPATSPYTSPSVALDFGPTHQKYFLPDILLRKLENIPSRDPWTGAIHLADVDASVGHVLVHFLYTGVYQTLDNKNIEDNQRDGESFVCKEFQTALLAVKLAKKYGVPGLQELAQIEVERQGMEMCLGDALHAIREDFIAGPSEEQSLLRDYVSGKVRWVFEHDRPAFSAPDFFESIESPTLKGLVAQVLVGLYSEEVEKLHEEKASACKVSAPEDDKLPGSRSGALDDSAAARDPHDLGQDSSSRLEDSEPLVSPSPIKEENYTKEGEDGQSWESYKDIVEVQQLQEDQATIAQSQEGSVAAASSTAIQDKSNEFEAESLSDSWGLSWVPKKKNKKKSTLTTDSAPPPALLPDVQSEVGATTVIAHVATLATVEPAGEKDPYAGLSKSQAETFKAKSDILTKWAEEEVVRREREKETNEIRLQEEEKEETRLKEEQCLAEENERLVREAEEEAERKKKQEQDANDWAAFGANAPGKKNTKKTKKTKRVLPRKDKALSEQIQCEDAAADVNGVGSTDAVSHDDNCEWRLEHLSSDNGWQNCRSCELYMRKIAIKLHSAELPIADRFSTIN